VYNKAPTKAKIPSFSLETQGLV